MNSKEISQSALFVTLLIVGSHLKIPIGLVPITFQVLVVVLIGLLLKRVQIILTIGTYILLGLIGLPVFSSGAGVSYILSPSFGFIIGFVFFALTINIENNKYIGVLVGYFILYFIGLSYLMLILYFILKTQISPYIAVVSLDCQHFSGQFL